MPRFSTSKLTLPNGIRTGPSLLLMPSLEPFRATSRGLAVSSFVYNVTGSNSLLEDGRALPPGPTGGVRHASGGRRDRPAVGVGERGRSLAPPRPCGNRPSIPSP